MKNRLLEHKQTLLGMLFSGLAALAVNLMALPSAEISTNLGLPASASLIKLTVETRGDFLLYENYGYEIRIRYPHTWEIQEIESQGTVARFLLPNYSASDSFVPSIIVMVEDLRKPMSLDEYTNSATKEITRFVANVEIIDSRSATLAKRRGHKIVYTGQDDGRIWQRLQFWTLKNNKAYIITYEAETSKSAKFLKTAQQMIDSFEIIETRQR